MHPFTRWSLHWKLVSRRIYPMFMSRPVSWIFLFAICHLLIFILDWVLLSMWTLMQLARTTATSACSELGSRGCTLMLALHQKGSAAPMCKGIHVSTSTWLHQLVLVQVLVLVLVPLIIAIMAQGLGWAPCLGQCHICNLGRCSLRKGHEGRGRGRWCECMFCAKEPRTGEAKAYH